MNNVICVTHALYADPKIDLYACNAFYWPRRETLSVPGAAQESHGRYAKISQETNLTSKKSYDKEGTG